MWMVIKYGGPHMCEKDIIPNDNVHFNKDFIGQEVCRLIEENLRFKPGEIRKLMYARYGYAIPYVKAWKARQKALKILFDDWKESFATLPTYMNALVEANPGTEVFWQTTPLASGDISVDRVFWAFYPSIKAFEACRPVLSIDGTHLYGKYKGVLLVAVGTDANEQVVPLCYALVESENTDSWSWFMACIRAGVTQREGLTVISDRHAGIMNAMKDPYWTPPMAYHRICNRHFVSNINKKFKDPILKRHLTHIAYLPQKKKFRAKYAEFRNILKDDINILRWLDEVPLESWALAYDEGGRRWRNMNTNKSEGWNNVVKCARDLPITALVNYTFRQANDYFMRRREKFTDWKGRYAPKIERIITRLIRKGERHDVEMFDRENSIARVTTCNGRNNHIVNITERSCTCGKWEAFHYPCSHVLAVCKSEHLSVANQVAPEYYIQAYRDTWAWTFTPLPDSAYWPIYDGPKYVPNIKYKRDKRGRPPSVRRHNEMDERGGRGVSTFPRGGDDGSSSQGGGDVGSSSQGNKATRVQKCSVCRVVGHNKKSCPNRG